MANQSHAEHSRKRFAPFPLTSLPVRILELFVTGCLCELLLQLSNVSIQFQMVD